MEAPIASSDEEIKPYRKQSWWYWIPMLGVDMYVVFMIGFLVRMESRVFHQSYWAALWRDPSLPLLLLAIMAAPLVMTVPMEWKRRTAWSFGPTGIAIRVSRHGTWNTSMRWNEVSAVRLKSSRNQKASRLPLEIEYGHGAKPSKFTAELISLKVDALKRLLREITARVPAERLDPFVHIAADLRENADLLGEAGDPQLEKAVESARALYVVSGAKRLVAARSESPAAPWAGRATLAIAECYSLQLREDKALAELETVVGSAEVGEPARFVRGLLRARKGETDAAIEDLVDAGGNVSPGEARRIAARAREEWRRQAALEVPGPWLVTALIPPVLVAGLVFYISSMDARSMVAVNTDSHGSIYAAFGKDVCRFDLSGRATLHLDRSREPGTAEAPRDVAASPDGTIYVADGYQEAVHEYTSAGRYVRSLPTGWPPNSYGVGRILLSAETTGVSVLADGRFLRFGEDGSGGRRWGDRYLAIAQGICTLSDGRIAIADWHSRRLVVIHADGTATQTVNPARPGDRFRLPVSVSPGPQGSVLAALETSRTLGSAAPYEARLYRFGLATGSATPIDIRYQGRPFEITCALPLPDGGLVVANGDGWLYRVRDGVHGGAAERMTAGDLGEMSRHAEQIARLKDPMTFAGLLPVAALLSLAIAGLGVLANRRKLGLAASRV